MEIIVAPTAIDTVFAEGEQDAVILESIESDGVVFAEGAQGAAGSSSDTVSYVASTNLSGNRAVCLNSSGELIYGDSSTVAHAHKILGITTGAITSGSSGNVRTNGEMTEAGWAWTIGSPIYLSTNGSLSQTAPVTGFSLVVAYALTATKIFIDIKQPIILS